jgi:hypothetical protein
MSDQCQSDLCSNTACVDTCTIDHDCATGSCKWYSPVLNQYVTACNGPMGTGANGASCTTNGDCRSGVCATGTCAALCSTSADCGSNQGCGPVDNSVCLMQIAPGFCGSWQYNIVTACLPITQGAGRVGDRCSSATDCATGLCDTSLGQCTDTCSRDAQCPGGDGCKNLTWATTAGGTGQYDLDLCVPKGY